MQDCFTVDYIEEILGAPNGSCGRCSAVVHRLPWLGLFLDSYGVRLGKEARLDTVHSLKDSKMRRFAHSPSRNSCEVWRPQLHLVPALTDRLLAHAFSPEDPPAARCRVLR